MTPEKFKQWLDHIKSAGIIKFDIDAGRLLGVNKITLLNYKQRGADNRVALACAAILAGLKPYGQD